MEDHLDRIFDETPNIGLCNYQYNLNIIILAVCGSYNTHVSYVFSITTFRNLIKHELLNELTVARVESYYEKIMKKSQPVNFLTIDRYFLIPTATTG